MSYEYGVVAEMIEDFLAEGGHSPQDAIDYLIDEGMDPADAEEVVEEYMMDMQ